MRIDMSHGSGGRSSAMLMEEIFGKYFDNEILGRLEDAAVLNIPTSVGNQHADRLAMSTDSFVVEPLIFNGGDIGKLAVCGTVNDLLVMGARPLYLTAGFILEEGLEFSTLEQIVRSMAETAKAAGVQIVAGDTKVVEGKGGGLYINTTGIGAIPAGRILSASSLKAGDVILVSGTMGDHHACILSHRMGMDQRFQSDCAPLSELTEALLSEGIRVKAMRDITRGGLGTVLNELASSSACTIEFQETSIPVHPEVRGFCDILGLDPLYMANEGKLAAVVHGEDAERALALWRKTSLGKDAVLLGSCVEGSGSGQVTMITRLGGRRTVDVLYGEGLPRIC